MSSRWSRDNLITCHPAVLYDGKVGAHVDLQAVEILVQDLEKQIGPVRTGACRMGAFTWDVACDGAGGPFILQLPLVVDEAGSRDRRKYDIPRRTFVFMKEILDRGLKRVVCEPKQVLTLGGEIPAAILTALPEHRPITFGRGSLQVEIEEGKLSWLVSLGPDATADLLAEMIAALAYLYDPGANGGTAVTDLSINDGDFVAKRRPDGSFDLKLRSIRRREGGIGPNLLLLYLLQMLAYEDWRIEGDLVGLPTPISNPSVTFAGVERGLRLRHLDLGGTEADGARQARQWIADFGRSREGRAYRPWAERFLAGHLPPSFGGDPRECWWRTVRLRTKQGVLELRARHDPDPELARSARDLKSFLDRLSREIGRAPENEPGSIRINDVRRDELERLLEEAGADADARARVAGQILAHWPYRSLEHLLARVPGARGLRRLKSRLSFGRVVGEADQGTVAAFAPPSKQPAAARAVANPELYGVLPLDPALHAAAVATFPTFEAYMDAALHEPRWGYYARGVAIGRGGHFITNPESLSPRYGQWIAAWIFRFWRDLIARGEISEADPFPIVEFGAGNGRLARDVVDAVRRRWPALAARVRYRIYETSAALRGKQKELLGLDAVVAEGDARRPGEVLARDFPGGLKGVVLTNEVPDAFGVHKVLLKPDGTAAVALVVPRLERSLREALDGDLARRIGEADASVRRTFALRGQADDLYLDGKTFAEVMDGLARLAAQQRRDLLDALWFEEAYVPVSVVPELAAHLSANASQYATAMAAEDSGVVLYVNVHAGRFIRELGSSLAAGFVVTTDYGDTTWGLVQGARRGEFPFRVYGDQQDFRPRPNDPYAAPGTQDMTADVNFTDLAQAGEAAGLTVIHYGPERDLVGDDLPDVLRGAADQESVAEFLGNPVFKVLVMAKSIGDPFADHFPMTALRLTARQQDLARPRREKVSFVASALRISGPRAR